MSAASNYSERKILDHVLTTSAFTQPSARYLALFNSTSGNTLANLQAGTLTDEISTSGSAYGRQTVTFASAATANGTTSSATNATVTFQAATSSWGTVTHIAVMDAATGGNVLFFGAVTTSKQIDTGDTFQVTSGNLTIALA
jgi:hypothetical protein